MHRKFVILTAVAALGVAPPALAQKSPAPVSADSKAGRHALLDDKTITVRNVTRAELVHGVPLLDDDGESVGIVERLAGNDVIVSDGGAEYRVPFVQIYAFTKNGVDGYASRTPRARMKREPTPPPAPPAPPPTEEVEGVEGEVPGTTYEGDPGYEAPAAPDSTADAPADLGPADQPAADPATPPPAPPATPGTPAN